MSSQISLHFLNAVLVLALSVSCACAGEVHLSPHGDDANPGTKSAPLRTFQKTFALLEDGDVLILHAGVYTEPLELDGWTKSITVKPSPGADVTLRGLREISTRWTNAGDDVWSTQIDFDVWQLFIGDRLVYLARWPNASFEDGSLWRMTQCMRNTDHGWDHKNAQPTGQTKPGVLFDAPFPVEHDSTEFREGDAEYNGGLPRKNAVSLAESGIDFTGALAVLNAGHWLTWTRPVTKHAAGDDHFAYDAMADTLGSRQSRIEMRKHVVYYMLGLPALDRPNEWWFDADTRTVYLKLKPGENPNTLPIQGKIRDHGIVLRNCAGLRFQDLRLFGQGFLLAGCKNIAFERCTFDYPATHRFPLGDFRTLSPGTPLYASSVARKDNEDIEFNDCVFAYSNAPIYLMGDRTRVVNCDFHDIEWDVNSSGGCGSIVLGSNGLFERNTVTRAGNSEGVRPCESGCTIRLNRISDMGNLQHDGAAINIGTAVQIGTVVQRNWTHDSNRQGVRFDYQGENVLRDDGLIHGDGVYRYNVSWNTQSSQVKGDRHLVLNNTVVNNRRYPNSEDELMNMGVMGFKAMHGLDFNEDSVTRNNLANLAHRSWNFNPKATPNAYDLPGTTDHNMRERGAAYRYLRDPMNCDFRPKDDSPLVDAGAELLAHEVRSPVITYEPLAFIGDAPDIGAYEAGDRRYWIPGRKRPEASSPVPRDGADNVPLDCDLMFLEANACDRHVVYFGPSRNSMSEIAALTDDSTNIVTPPALEAGTTYYWGVVAMDRQGRRLASNVWTFTTAPNAAE